MPDMTAIATALTSLKSAGDIAKAMIGMRDDAAFKAKMIEFQAAIIEAQNSAIAANEERATLVERIRELEKQVADLEAWEREKQRYELVSLAPNVVAYAVKDALRGAEPPHYICANCLTGGKKSFLQQYVRGSAMDKYRCNGCGEDLAVDKSDGRPHSALPRRSGGPQSWMGS